MGRIVEDALRNDAILTLIAVEVGKNIHSTFVTSIARAWSVAEPRNNCLIRTAWGNVIDRYGLREVYWEEIEDHIPEYLTEEPEVVE